MHVNLLYYMGAPEVLPLNMMKGMQHQPSCPNASAPEADMDVTASA